jgi:hypothetical protein
MTQQRSRPIPVRLILCSIALLVPQLAGSAVAADDKDHDEVTLVGTWRESVIFAGFRLSSQI